jgi:beta-glucosidase
MSQLLMAQPPSQGDVEKRVEAILGRMTLAEKIDYIGGFEDFYVRAYPHLGITSLKMSDGPLGVRNYGPATAFPAGIAMAASWDTALENRVGMMMGKDARARGVHFLLAPGMNIYRAPMCGRNFEYFGEDPYLAARMAVADIRGVQSQGVIATAKHFMGNNQEWDRNNVSSDIDERTLREIYLPAFEAAVKEAKVGAIMDAYNLVNGVHMTQNDFLNNQVVKKEWGFDGIIMSDWDATYDAVAAANSGLDLEMPSGKFMNRKLLLPAIEQGKVPVAVIDDKVRRILRKAIEFGFFDRDQTDHSIPLDNPEAHQVALEAARGGIVLLKNAGNLLPLDGGKLKTIAVVGPNASRAVTGGGGSSRMIPFSAVSFLDGIRKRAGTQVVFSPGVTLPRESANTTEFFTDAARKEPGLKGEYFDNPDLAGAPALLRVDRHINFRFPASFRDGGPTENFSVRWSGYYVPAASGEYELYVAGDSGYRVYVDDKQVVTSWRGELKTREVHTLTLEAGRPYKIKLDYYKHYGDEAIALGLIQSEGRAVEEAKAVAAKADAAIVCVGFDANSESEGGDRTFQLPAAQAALIRGIQSVNKNTIIVLTAGGAVDMTGWVDQTPAIVHTWYLGQEGGTALAQILFGDFSPSGKLPASFERRWEDNATFGSYYDPNREKRVAYKEGVFLGYRHFDQSGKKPLFPFGYGLSYTTFQYGNLHVTPQSGAGEGPVTVTFDLKNAGRREGAEVAQLYVGDKHSHVARPVKELKGFAKVNLKPGEVKQVRLTLDRRAFSYYDVARKQWTAEPGDFAILVGSSSEKIELQGKFTMAR